MQFRRPMSYAVRPLLVAALGAAALTACGTTPSRVPGGDAVGTVRPVASQPVSADGALACPASVASAEAMTVPRRPEGVVGQARLLPDRLPSSLVVCGYPVMAVSSTRPLTAPFRMHERTVVTGAQRQGVVDLLAWAPRWNGREHPCTMMAGDETAYLVGAAYGDAVVWVAAKADANACSRATNGDFVSGAPVGVTLRELLAHVPQPDRGAAACGPRTWGRLGDDTTLAPPGDPAVTVCRSAADGTTRPTSLDADRSRQVVAALRALDTRPTDGACQGSGKVSDARFGLVLAYAVGPAVRVGVDPECAPSVLGSNLEADDAAPLVDLVERWSPPVPGPDPNGSVSSP